MQSRIRVLIMSGLAVVVLASRPGIVPVRAADNDGFGDRALASARKGLDFLSREQRGRGYWEANNNQYRVAMTALAGLSMLAEGSTPTVGRYAPNIRRAVDYLMQMSRPNGLIGFQQDFHYMYGHGFAMLFLSQVYGEEEDLQRREQLRRVLTRAVVFCADAQTSRGGWGYVSAKDGGDRDEGSTCITQVQGLRACRNAGIPVARQVIDRAKEYIRKCTTANGGVLYQFGGGGERPAITAAALAAMFNAGEYDSEHTQKMLKFCDANVWPGRGSRSFFGHWHYAHFYYAQVMYRRGGDNWNRYFNEIGTEIVRKQSADGAWRGGFVGDVYTTALNATVLQLNNGYLPIFQR